MVQDSPVVSVVIPCRNHAVALARCLDSVMLQQLAEGFEVIVVDSATDDCVAAVVSEHVRARLVRSTAPLLPGPARNLGARNARGAYLAFIDADCIAEGGWLAAALLELKAGARVVGGAVLQAIPWHPVASIDNLMQFSDLPGGRARGFARLLPSCNLGMAVSDFMLLGGFPAVELPAGEDVLFCRSASERWPRQMLFCPSMRVRHFGRSTLRQLWAHQHMFGYARAIYGLELRPVYRRLGRWAIMAPAVAVKRLAYMAARAARWQPGSLGAMMLFLPVLLFAMTAWCAGFHRGCRTWAASL